MAREILTAYDVVEACSDWLGVGHAITDLRKIKRAMRSALGQVCQDAPSEYMQKKGRLHFTAPQTDGTVQYTHSTRLLTLTHATATWPSNAVDYSVIVDNKICDIETRVSDSVVRLDVALNPGEDVDAGTSYTLVQRYYRLPDDFAETDDFWSENIPELGVQVPMGQMVGLNRQYASTGSPRCWAIGGIQDQMGARGLFIYPFADAAVTQDYVYRRQPREIRHTGFGDADVAGTITVSADSTDVTGNSSNFASTMVGAILRVGTSSNYPTGMTGEYPSQYERLIHTFTSTTAISIDRVLSSTSGVTTVKYRITDPIDIDPMLYDLFLCRCRMELAQNMDEAVMTNLVAAYSQKLHTARCAIVTGSQVQAPLQPRILSGTHVVISSEDG